jgi:Ca-activated chloride channel family protein
VISFASPWAFVLLVPALLLPLQPRVTGVLRLAVPGPSAHAAGWTLRRALAWLPTALQVVGLALLVIALARPQLNHKSTVVTSDGLDIMLAIDTSGSMRAEDFSSGISPVNRLEVAKAVMAEFVRQRPYDRIGVVAFGSEAFTHVPLTLDHDTLLAVLGSIQIGIAGEGSTAVGTAIAVASKRLKELTAPSKIVILLTDGRSNAGRLSPLEAADLAATLGIKVYTIGVGADRRIGPFSMQADGIDEDTLKAVSATTKARFFRAGDTRALKKVYDTIDELEPSPAEVEELVEHEELFRRFLVPGTVLLVAQLLLSATWLRRFP